MDRSGASRSFENNYMDDNDVPISYFDADNFINHGLPPATCSDIDSMLDFIFNEESNSSTSSDSTISEEPRGVASTSRTLGYSSNQSSSDTTTNGNQQANDEADVLLKLNKKIKKVEKEVEELRKSISGLCKQ